MTTLEQMQAEVQEFCKAKGWLDKPVSFGEAMALLHSEISEALEAYRLWGTADVTNAANAGKIVKENPPKPEGVGSEFADVFIRLLDDCERFGIDLRAEYERKMAYNWTRAYRHGGKSL